MFQIGDKIMYPTHGAGIVEQIKEEEIDGEIKQFYIIQLIIQELRIMIPVGKEDKIGVRPIVDCDTLKNIIIKLQSEETNHELSQKERININKEKIKSGKFDDLIGVVRDLSRFNEEKPLNAVEKQLLSHAKAILQSEVQLVHGVSEEDIFCFSS